MQPAALRGGFYVVRKAAGVYNEYDELKEVKRDRIVDYQGFVWESGLLPGRVFLFPANRGMQELCIGSIAEEEPDLLIKTDSYVYLCIGGAANGDPRCYEVITDFDGPVRRAYSGDVLRWGTERFRLI